MQQRIIKLEHPNAKSGIYRFMLHPEKAGSFRRTVRSDVDFVITVEYRQYLMPERSIPAEYEADRNFHDTVRWKASLYRGGVANTIENVCQ